MRRIKELTFRTYLKRRRIMNNKYLRFVMLFLLFLPLLNGCSNSEANNETASEPSPTVYEDLTEYAVYYVPGASNPK